MERQSDYLEMTLPAKPQYVGIARLTVSGLANRLGFSYDDIEDIKIAIAEACTNVVNHAYEETGNMHLSCNVFEDRVEMVVADTGQSFVLEELDQNLGPVDSRKPIDELKEGGLGLFLIDTLMDKVEISGEDGVAISMTKFLQRDEVENNVDGVSTETNTQEQK